LQVCLKYDPDDLLVLNDLYGFFGLARNYEQALEVAHQFNERCTTTPLKLYGNYLLLELFLRRGAWLEIQPVVERHKQLLQEIIQQPPQALEPIVSEILSLLLATSPFACLEDNPVETHGFQNHIARLLQQTLQSRIPLPQSVAPTRSKDPQKPLKIGYIAHSLRKHSVGYLCRWLFHYHDREAFHLSLYLVNQNEDELTQQWFRVNSDRAYNFPLDPKAIATQIQQDEIDILIDLDSITHGVTCQVMALKPAPVQVTWLGKDASGLPAIDYFIADPHVLPKTAQDYYQAQIWRLPHTYIAVDGFEVGVPTLRRDHLDIPDGAIAYLSLQNAWKLHPETIRLQMKIIRAVPNSYLLIKGIADETTIQQLFTQIAELEGVSPEKLRFLRRDLTPEIHRANLAIADVVLDTYPYNGATTTLEVLWMGIPVVTRVGEQFAARNSYAFMTNAGLTEGIAWSDEEYVEWGIRLGKDEALREQIAWKLKRSRQTSPLWNARQFTKEMEKAYQQMWVT
jgi:predicted O-linked N-acetylglucosamine transferase (SPINDLY family)